MSITKTVCFDKEVFEKVQEEQVKRKFKSVSRTVNVLLEEHFENKDPIKLIGEPNIIISNKTRKPSEILSRSQKREFKERFKPLIENLGAKRISEGVYELNGFLCYPSTNNAVNTRDRSIRMNLEDFIKKQKN